MTTASAPGKIILFGEHAVVYARPALAAPVFQAQAKVEVRDSSRLGVWIDAPNISLRAEYSALAPTHALRAAIDGVFHALSLPAAPCLNIHIQSQIPVASGLGSGAAVSVALIRALSAHLGQPLSDEQVNALAYQTETIYHGTPSGIDNTVITYARPVYYRRGEPIQTLRVGAPLHLLIADSGIPAPTRESVAAVRQLWQADSARWEAVFDKVGQLAQAARAALQAGLPQELGHLMNENHALLQEMTVSCSRVDALVETARNSGAWGAKVSGGGRGGNLIALVAPGSAESVSAALLAAGAVRVLQTEVA